MWHNNIKLFGIISYILEAVTASTFMPCNSWVAFVGDASNSIPPHFYSVQNEFIIKAISEFNHPERLSVQNGIDSEILWNSGFSITRIQYEISEFTQNPDRPLRLRTVLFALFGMVQDTFSSPSPMAAIVFVSDTSNPEIYRGADQPANLLKASNVKLTIVLVGANANQANLANLTDNFIFWPNLTNTVPDDWVNLRLSAYNCPAITASTFMPFNNLTTTTASIFSPCNSWVAFVGDASNSIPSLDYTKQNDFISTAISEFNHPERLSFQNGIDSEIPWLSGSSIDKIRFYISTSTENPNLPLRLRTMLYVLYEMIQSLSAIPSPMAAIVFVSDTSNPEIYCGADQPANLLKASNVKLTIVLVGINANQANLVNLTDNFIFWPNLTNPMPENWETLSLSAYNCPTF